MAKPKKEAVRPIIDRVVRCPRAKRSRFVPQEAVRIPAEMARKKWHDSDSDVCMNCGDACCRPEG